MTGLAFNISMIKLNTDCKHNAYKENCLCCMFSFAVYYKKEIDKDGLDKTIEKVKSSGGFLI